MQRLTESDFQDGGHDIILDIIYDIIYDIRKVLPPDLKQRRFSFFVLGWRDSPQQEQDEQWYATAMKLYWCNIALPWGNIAYP